MKNSLIGVLANNKGSSIWLYQSHCLVEEFKAVSECWLTCVLDQHDVDPGDRWL